jgi:hypothetical protein
MDSQKNWECPYCLVPNLPQNDKCRSCKKTRTTKEELNKKYSKVEDRFVHVFMVAALLLALGTIVAARVNPVMAISILLLIWWIGLGFFAAQPASGSFLHTRALAQQLIDRAESETKRTVARTIYKFLYWPILISKDVYFAITMILAGLYAFFYFRNG